MPKGRFITFEGGDGSGKSTQVSLLCDALKTKGLKVVQTREPGGAPGAEDIRKLLVEGETDRWDGLTEALLHYAARRNHMEKTILPALKAGKWVVCDRFADSTMAYQGYGHGMDLNQLKALHETIMGDFAPDLTLILDFSADAGLKRAATRDMGEDRYERMGRSFHKRLRQGFLDIAKEAPERCIVLSANDKIETVHQNVMEAINQRLGQL